jgi:hypothetical protein
MKINFFVNMGLGCHGNQKKKLNKTKELELKSLT